MHKKTNRTNLLTALALASFFAPALLAVDGVIEINMAAATAGGISAGDTPGLPVTLSEEGSYRLTGNLTTASPNQTVIEITTSFVTIDLNGFTISGPNAVGTGNGITTENAYHATVRNGVVRGMGSGGVRLTAPFSTVENVDARRNQDDGIQVGLNGVVRNCVASFNGDIGIVAGAGGSVSLSTSGDNGTNSGSASGIRVGNGGAVIDSIARDNIGEGIVAGIGATVKGNTVYDNTKDGVSAGTGCLLSNNTARDNGGFGLSMGVISGFGGNVLTGNVVGAVSASGSFEIGTNVCGSNTSC